MRVVPISCGQEFRLFFVVIALSTWFLCVAEPPLPVGLDSATARNEPALPSGLTSSSPPPLPPGLDSNEGPTEPALPPGLAVESSEDLGPSEELSRSRSAVNFRGFIDVRAGTRVQSDPAQSKDTILGEIRLQLKTEKDWEKVFFEFTGDSVFDAIDERARLDIRQLRFTWTPLDALDIRIGRQVLTWGTGDMLFINDLFPKDWVSFFSGRDTEYLKAPSNTLRVGWFNDWCNVEVAYTPQFEPDRYITGRRISYYNPLWGRTAGSSNRLETNEPDDWFDQDEWALRLYRNIGSAQFALYGYSGYWKSPAGMQLLPFQGVFPKLRVYGASLRGTLGRGIAHVEMGYYDSYQDSGGRNAFINNSEFRFLIGYEQEIAKEFTAGVQYYLEHMMDYRAYRDSLPFFMVPRDEDRHVFTLRLTKLLMNQNLILSLFGYISPSDKDAYLRPQITYKINDHWTMDAGCNIFLGSSYTSFFGQFQDNSNIYMGIRVAF